MSAFVTGRELSSAFYREILAPAIEAPHAAALLGTGSDVLGYDTERSVDHDWGPRAVILVDRTDVSAGRRGGPAALPARFRGWPVSTGRDGVPARPQVDVTTLSAWVTDRLGFDPGSVAMTYADWLVMPQQRILETVSGRVFHDDTGGLTAVRSKLAWYPDDVWWWMLACQWDRLAQQEAFVQRTAEVGDDVGSAVVTARLVRDLMCLALLMERRYAPYEKWLGTAFSRLADPEGLGPRLASALTGRSLHDRESALGAGYQVLAARFNALANDLDVDPRLRRFHDRPARVLRASRFAEAARVRVDGPGAPRPATTGSIDQVVDNVDVLTQPKLAGRLRPCGLRLSRRRRSGRRACRELRRRRWSEHGPAADEDQPGSRREMRTAVRLTLLQHRQVDLQDPPVAVRERVNRVCTAKYSAEVGDDADHGGGDAGQRRGDGVGCRGAVRRTARPGR